MAVRGSGFKVRPDFRGVRILYNIMVNINAINGYTLIFCGTDWVQRAKQFLLLLREMIGINRAAVFLRQPSTWPAEKLALDENRRLRAAHSWAFRPDCRALRTFV